MIVQKVLLDINELSTLCWGILESNFNCSLVVDVEFDKGYCKGMKFA